MGFNPYTIVVEKLEKCLKKKVSVELYFCYNNVWLFH